MMIRTQYMVSVLNPNREVSSVLPQHETPRVARFNGFRQGRPVFLINSDEQLRTCWEANI